MSIDSAKTFMYDFSNVSFREFPHSPVVENLLSHCQGPGFDLWLGNLDPTRCVAR